MKIFIVDPWGTEGQSIYDVSLCSKLSELDQDVNLLTCTEFEFDYKQRNFPILRVFHGVRGRKLPRILKAINYFVSLVRLINVIKREKPEIIHYQFVGLPIMDYFVIKYLKKYNVKIVFTVHDIKPGTDSFIQSIGLRRFFQLFDNIIVHSEETRNRLCCAFDLNNRHIKVIPHGSYKLLLESSNSCSKTGAKKYLDIDERKKAILFFGTILPYKGLEFLIRAFAKITASHQECVLLIAGSTRGKSFQRYSDLIDNLKIEDRVKLFIKYIPRSKIIYFLKASEFIVLPYLECFTPGVAHLALSFGLPVIAFDVGAVRSVVKNGITGYLAKPKNINHLAKIMLHCLKNPHELLKIGNNAKDMMLSDHSWDKIALQTLGIYRNLMK